ALDVARSMPWLRARLLPSGAEPFGRALLEAMALEVPVVATSAGGPPELIRDGREGYLAPPGDTAAWARAVRQATDDPEHGRSLGRAGRVRLAEGFDVAHHVAAYLDVYERATGRRSGIT